MCPPSPHPPFPPPLLPASFPTETRKHIQWKKRGLRSYNFCVRGNCSLPREKKKKKKKKSTTKIMGIYLHPILLLLLLLLLLSIDTGYLLGPHLVRARCAYTERPTDPGIHQIHNNDTSCHQSSGAMCAPCP